MTESAIEVMQRLDVELRASGRNRAEAHGVYCKHSKNARQVLWYVVGGPKISWHDAYNRVRKVVEA